MSSDSRLHELKRQHKELSRMVEKTQRTIGTDDIALIELKKRKLKVKEQIQRMSAG